MIDACVIAYNEVFIVVLFYLSLSTQSVTQMFVLSRAMSHVNGTDLFLYE